MVLNNNVRKLKWRDRAVEGMDLAFVLDMLHLRHRGGSIEFANL